MLSADRRLQFGHYDKLIRALRMEDSSSFFNYLGMEPLMFDEILNKVGPRILKYFVVLLLWIFYTFVLSCVCYVFVCVCLYVLCGHLLGKD